MAELIPFDDRDGNIWFDGKLIDWRDAQVHVLTHGLHYASCVFEGERCYGGTIFKAREHGERLAASANILGFEIPWSLEALQQARYDVLKANNIVDGYVRPVAWRGSEMMGVAAQKNTIHVAIAAWDWPSYFSPEARQRGIRLAVSEWKRPSPAGSRSRMRSKCLSSAAGDDRGPALIPSNAWRCVVSVLPVTAAMQESTDTSAVIPTEPSTRGGQTCPCRYARRVPRRWVVRRSARTWP